MFPFQELEAFLLSQDVRLAEVKTTALTAHEVLSKQECGELAAQLDSIIISFNDQCSVLLGTSL